MKNVIRNEQSAPSTLTPRQVDANNIYHTFAPKKVAK